VVKHYAAICLALEAIHVESGTTSCEARGLLLTFGKSSTLQFLLVLQHFLQPLARLNKTLQSSTWNIASAMAAVKATVSTFREDLALVRVSNAIPEMKQVLNAVNTFYSLALKGHHTVP